ncbi:MAG: thermonuclease family protein [Candidatus Gracilibacteria bacterium]
MDILKTLTIILIIFTYSINITNAQNNILPKNTIKECIIINIDDGDTFDLLCKNKEYFYNVRTLGVNAPDFGNNIDKNYKHCYYDEAKKIISSIKEKKIILIVEFYGSDLCKDKDKGCRNLIRIIDKNTGLDINELLIRKGYNFSWTQFSMIPKKLKAKYFIAEKRAEAEKIGLWGKCEIVYNKGYNYLDSSKPNKMTN